MSPLERKGEEKIFKELNLKDGEARLKALRAVKNQIIGNKTKKLTYLKLGVVPKVVETLESEENAHTLVQAAVTLGSFACGTEEGVSAVLQSGAVPLLLRALAHPDLQVILAANRSLKLIFNSKLAPRDLVYEAAALQRVLGLLFNDNIQVAEGAMGVLARCCETREQQSALQAAGVLPRLLTLLQVPNPTVQMAALELLAALTADNKEITSQLLEQEDGAAVQRICYLSQARMGQVRMSACSCLANLACHPTTTTSIPAYNHHHHQHVSSTDNLATASVTAATAAAAAAASVDSPMTDSFPPVSGGMGMSSGPSPRQLELAALALPVAVNLVGPQEEGVRDDAPRVLARLVAGNEHLQKVAVDANAIPRLANILKDWREVSPRLLESTLLALAALTECLETSREQLVQQPGALDHIARALSDNHQSVRIAACRCCLSLSRSVKSLRMALVDCCMATHLLKLLGDNSTAVQSAASAPLCNLVLEFSAVQAQVLTSGGLSQLAVLTQSPCSALRLNAVWALQNLLFSSSPHLKRQLMQAMPYTTHLRPLLEATTEPMLQACALNLLRNLVHGQPSDVAAVLDYSDRDVLRVLESSLASTASVALPTCSAAGAAAAAAGGGGAASSTSQCSAGVRFVAHECPVALHSLYVVSNIATGVEDHKNALMSTSIPASLATFLHPMTHKDLRLAALWCVINLGWSGRAPQQPDRITGSPLPPADSDLQGGAHERLRALERCHILLALQKMKNDTSRDVQERVQTALENFSNMPPLDKPPAQVVEEPTEMQM